MRHFLAPALLTATMIFDSRCDCYPNMAVPPPVVVCQKNKLPVNIFSKTSGDAWKTHMRVQKRNSQFGKSRSCTFLVPLKKSICPEELVYHPSIVLSGNLAPLEMPTCCCQGPKCTFPSLTHIFLSPKRELGDPRYPVHISGVAAAADLNRRPSI